MMKKTKSILKKLLVTYLIIYIVLSSMTTCFARKYDEECGKYVSQYARDFIEKYCTPVDKTHYDCSTLYPHWGGGKEFQGDFYACCSTGVWYMYKNALGVDIYKFDFAGMCNTARSNMLGSSNWEEIKSAAEAKPGDIVINDHHTEMYIGESQNANFGNSPHSGKITTGPRYGEFTNIFRPTFDVNPSGTIPIDEIEEENLSIYDENGFIYSGVAELQGYDESPSFGKWIFEKITEILDYLVGILTFGIRVVIVGWTAIIERFVIDGIVNAVTGVTNERVDDWQKDPDSEDEIDRELQQEQSTIQDDPPEATGQPGDPDYVSEGMQGVADIGGKVQLNVSSEANVTVENIVYNKIPILDINFFNFESAGGSVVDENGIIYIIKENVAMWYYIFRILAIVIMLLVLIYIGIRMAFSTVAEKKAVYKQMLVSWIAGFLLVFAINYIMYAVIQVNEMFINWIIPKYETGQEISLYESVRSKAYELKASTGFAGMIMYIILVYYGVRFLLVYFKRFLTVMILALLSPFVAVSYAIQKVSKNGRGKGEIYGNWFKDFTYTVLLQSIHALIYTIFIQTILDLTETSLIGIFISFIFLNFMVKVDPIMRKIFGFARGQNASKLSVEPLAPKIAAAKYVGSKAKKVGKFYGNIFGKAVSKPLGAAGRRVSDALDELRDNADQRIINDARTPEERKRKAEELRQKRERQKKNIESATSQIALGLKAGKDMAMTFFKGALVVPMLIVEPNLGIQILSSTLSSSDKVTKTLREAKKKGYRIRPAFGNSKYNKRFKKKGIIPRNSRAAARLTSRFSALGINYGVQQHENRGKPLTQREQRAIEVRNHIQNLRLVGEAPVIPENLNTTELGEYGAILIKAQNKEKEIEISYKEMIAELDKQIAEMEKTNPEFAKQLKEKREKELDRVTKVLLKPLSEKDIFEAMENYKSKVPTFNSDVETLSERDIEGITKEINHVLEMKGQDVQMSKEFMEKVKKELTDNHRRMLEEKARREGASQLAGQDVSARGKNVVEEKKKTLTEKIRQLNVDDRNNPYAESNTNAPRQNSSGSKSHSVEKNSSLDRLAQGIRRASRGSVSKVPIGMTPASIRFAKKIEELEDLNEEAAEITGEEIYDIDTILERLKDL